MTHSAFWSRLVPFQRKLGMGLLVAAVLSVGSAVAQQGAPTQSYNVELLIFRNLGGTETPETWPVEATAADPPQEIPDDDLGATEAPAPTAPTVSFPSLAPSQMKLSGMEQALRRNRAYEPVAHIGWTQPGFARDAAKYLSVSSLVPGSSGLQGQIALSRGRYLHLTLDLVLDAAGEPGEPPQHYVLRQTRRMRSNERHYIDSPKFGVIAVITPVG